MKESTLVTKIIKEVRKRYPRAYCRKFSDRFQRGIPDILIAVPILLNEINGEILFNLWVEAKTDTGRLSILQRMEGNEINRLPCALWMVARSVEEVIQVLVKHGAVG